MKLSDSLYMGLVLTGIFLSVAGMAIVYYGTPTQYNIQSQITPSTVEHKMTPSGTPYIVHPDKLTTHCLGADCVPSLYHPSIESADRADMWLNRTDYVGGITYQNETLAVPVRILERHYVVNTVIGEEPIVVVYSPASGLISAFSRRLPDGTPVVFEFSGKLHNRNTVLTDKRTGSMWSQGLEQAIIGPQVPTELKTIQSTVTHWQNWKESHSDTNVISMDTGVYNRSQY